MKTRLFAWLGMALLSAALVIFPLHRASAGDPQTSGSQLEIIGKDGVPAGFVPLKHTAIHTEISGFVAKISVTQEYENVLPIAVEAIYVFPLPQESAVDGMTMLVGDREIRAVIHEREEARKIYEQARNTGHTAALLDQERPNIFTQSVANIPPNSKVEVTLSVIEMLKYEAGTYQFVFPLVVGPRYIPGQPGGPPTQGTMPDTDRVPDASKISPPVAGVHTGDERAGHDISMDVNLAAGVYVSEVSSDSHKIAAERTGPDSFHVQLADDAVRPNKDFILKYKVAGAGITDAVLTHADSSGGYFTLILQPPERVPDNAVVPRELIFVLDTSGSMSGFPIDMAKKTIARALDNLRPDETFNLITFSGDTRILFPAPAPATPGNVAAAQKVLAGAYGSGGTEMMKAIRTALGDDAGKGKQFSGTERVRVVCFMTDGYVGDDAEIVAEVQKHPEARVFAFGIGTAVNRFLLSKMAEEGHGEVEFVTAPNEAQPAADRFYERVHSPVLTNISIEWNGLPVEEVYPAQVRDLFAAKPIIITGRYTQAAQGTVVIRGTRAGGPFERALRIDLPAANEDHAVLEKIWARRKVEDYMSQDWLGIQQGQSKYKAEIIKVGLAHSLATQYTSFVAVETKTVVQDGKPVRIEVPVELPEGVSKLAVPGESMPAKQYAYMNTNGGAGFSSLALSPPSPGMSYGSATQMVEVSADSPMIETSSAQVTNTFSGVLLHGPEGASGGGPGMSRTAKKLERKDKALQAKLSPELLQAYQCATARAVVNTTDSCKNAASGSVKVSVTLSSTSPRVVQKLTMAGLKIESGTGSTVVIGTIDIARLNQLAMIAEVVSAKQQNP